MLELASWRRKIGLCSGELRLAALAEAPYAFGVNTTGAVR